MEDETTSLKDIEQQESQDIMLELSGINWLRVIGGIHGCEAAWYHGPHVLDQGTHMAQPDNRWLENNGPIFLPAAV